MAISLAALGEILKRVNVHEPEVHSPNTSITIGVPRLWNQQLAVVQKTKVSPPALVVARYCGGSLVLSFSDEESGVRNET